MALFGKSSQEKAEEVRFEIRTDNSWLTYNSTPKVIVRQILNGGLEKSMNRGCNPVSPYLRMSDCVRVVEYDEVFEVHLKSGSVVVVPKVQVIEIQYF